jgi:23S rRNA (adenine2030-N6)-methyltransferase
MAPPPYKYQFEEWIAGHGNVLKHVALTTTVREMQKTHPEGILFVDCMAGDGIYDLNQHVQAKAYRKGIIQVMEHHEADIENTPDVVQQFIQLITKITGCTSSQDLDVYPGSPILIQHLLRPIDEHRLLNVQSDLEIQWLQTNAQTMVRNNLNAYDIENSIEYILPYTDGGKHPVILLDPDYTDDVDYAQTKQLLLTLLDQCPHATILVSIPMLQNHKFRWNYTTGLRDLAKRYCTTGRYYCNIVVAKDGYQGDGVLICNPTADLDDVLNEHCVHWLAHVMNQGKDEYTVEQVMKKKK